MNKIAATILLFGLCGAAQAQFQSDDEVVAAALNQKKFSQNLGRHHISLGLLGYFKATSGDFELPELGIDASQGMGEFLNYRYSFDKNIDLAVDVHGWMSETEFIGIKAETTVMGLGLGVRYNPGNLGGRLFPYVQANVYSVTEQLKISVGGWSDDARSDPSIGFGVNGGFEIRLGKLISIPFDGYYLYGKPADDVSGYGFATGISFNWGDVN
ncbi:MAG: hypothetical protein RDU76_00995 [Candidatus Edwardsbacteria bacterium]|nr:hypothetical protein [Candidatus Edwardsbacteria bacterium]